MTASLFRRLCAKGLSLVEAAFCMVLVLLTVAVVFNMMGLPRSQTTRLDTTGDNAFFSSAGKFLEFKNKEMTLANSMIESVIAGDIDPGRQFNQSCPVPVSRNGMRPFLNNSFPPVRLPANAYRGTFTSPVCQANLNTFTMYYRWNTARIFSGNPVNSRNQDRFDLGVLPVDGTEQTVTIPRRVNFKGNSEDDKSYNEYYVSTLDMYNTAGDANAQVRPVLSIPFSFYFNQNEPEQVQARLAVGIQVDRSASMAEIDGRDTGLPRIIVAGQAIVDFLKTMEQDPYVSDLSAVGLVTYNQIASTPDCGQPNVRPLCGDINFPDGQYPNRSFNKLKDLAVCFRQFEDGDPNCTNKFTVPEGGSNLYSGLNQCPENIPAFSNSTCRLPLFMGNQQVSNEFFSRPYDRAIIFISDGFAEQSKTGAPTNPVAANQEIVQLARAIVRKAPSEGAVNFGATRPMGKNGTVNIFTIGMFPENPAAIKLMKDVAAASPNGLYLEVRTASGFIEALQQVETQFQIFALRRKTERYGFEI
jgi:hypothetical protein